MRGVRLDESCLTVLQPFDQRHRCMHRVLLPAVDEGGVLRSVLLGAGFGDQRKTVGAEHVSIPHGFCGWPKIIYGRIDQQKG